MSHDDHIVEFNFKFSQCNLLDETAATTLNIPSNHRRKNKKKDQIKDQQPARPNLHDMETYEKKLLAFCGLWEDYPHRRYRMEFRIEMGQLVGYSSINGGKALASYDGHLINMIIAHSKETGRPLDHYRGCLGWNQKYIRWEKEDSSQESGWRSTRRWIRID